MPLANLPAGLFAIGVIFVAGGTLFSAIVSEPQQYFRLERAAYCYPLGLVALGMPMFLLSLAGFHLNVVMVTGVVAAAAIAVGMARRVSLRTFWLSPGPVEMQRQRLSEFEWFLLLIIVLCLGARTAASLLAPLNDWDGIAIWGLKAKILYYDTVKTTDYFIAPEYSYSHTPYPLGWPLMYAWMCTAIGGWDDLAMLLLNPLNLIIFAMLLYYSLRRRVARTVALGVTAIMSSLPALLHYTECGQADVPLMLISGASLLCLFEWMNERRASSLWLAAILMGGALFTKQEGKIIFIAQCCAGALSVWLGETPQTRRKYSRQLAIYIVIAILWALPWLLFERGIANYAWDFGGRGVRDFRYQEIPTLCKTIIANAVNFSNQVRLPKWNFLWPILAFGLVTQRTWRHRPWGYLLLVFALHATGIGALFLISRVELTLQAMEIAFERFTLVMLPPLWLVLAKCADDSWTIWKKSALPTGSL